MEARETGPSAWGRIDAETGPGRLAEEVRVDPARCVLLVLRAVVSLALPLRRTANEITEDPERDEDTPRFGDEARDPAVGEDQAQPCESTHRPPTVKRTMSTSIGYCVQSAMRGV